VRSRELRKRVAENAVSQLVVLGRAWMGLGLGKQFTDFDAGLWNTMGMPGLGDAGSPVMKIIGTGEMRASHPVSRASVAVREAARRTLV
jgi:hypothetical protein